MTARAIDLPDAYYTVPTGKLVNAVTWLEMRTAPECLSHAPLVLRPADQSDPGAYHALFRAIGTPWLWSRAYKSNSGNSPSPTVPPNVHLGFDGGRLVGLVGFGAWDTPDIELSWFGLLPDATGAGRGRRMMAAALRVAWAEAPQRVWLHTCNFDHPGAIRFYTSCGFVPYATGFEIMDDPRLNGEMPKDAAPHVPLIARVESAPQKDN